jgi:hypothetical protein
MLRAERCTLQATRFTGKFINDKRDFDLRKLLKLKTPKPKTYLSAIAGAIDLFE